MKKLIGLLLVTSFLTACNTMAPTTSTQAPEKPQPRAEQDGPPAQKVTVDYKRIPNAKPKAEAKSKYGNPQVYQVNGSSYHVMPTSNGYHATGLASWYGTKFHHKRTSSGEPYNMFAMTAAHRSLPLPTYLKVRNVKNDQEVIVKVNDRGPFHSNRIIDLSYVAAKKLGITGAGTGLVEISAVNVQRAFPDTNPSYMYLQLGAFANQHNALAFASKIRGLVEKPVQLKPTYVGEKSIFKVLIGPYKGYAATSAASQHLKIAGITNPMTVIR